MQTVIDFANNPTSIPERLADTLPNVCISTTYIFIHVYTHISKDCSLLYQLCHFTRIFTVSKAHHSIQHLISLPLINIECQ